MLVGYNRLYKLLCGHLDDLWLMQLPCHTFNYVLESNVALWLDACCSHHIHFGFGLHAMPGHSALTCVWARERITGTRNIMYSNSLWNHSLPHG